LAPSHLLKNDSLKAVKNYPILQKLSSLGVLNIEEIKKDIEISFSEFEKSFL
jgi:hypothetical protein